MIFDITEQPKLLESVLLIPIKNRAQAMQFISDMADKPLVCEIKEKRAKRSMNANAYCWTLIDKIAEATKLSNQDVYELMLKRYSKAYTFVILKPEAVQQFIRTCADSHMYVEELGETSVKDQNGIQLKVFYGSSTFDTKQMSRLIDGIVSEAKDLSIQTETPEELARMKQEWSK